MKAFKMPKETAEEKKTRSDAIQRGYQKAAQVPLNTAQTCEKILDFALVIAEKGNQNSITDAGVAAIMAQAGVESALYNVEINLGSIKDESFVSEVSSEIISLKKDSKEKTGKVCTIVQEALK